MSTAFALMGVLPACSCRAGCAPLRTVAGAAQIGSTYLALGDSLAYGYHAAQFKREGSSTRGSRGRYSTWRKLYRPM